MAWQIKIEDPSGETRVLPLAGFATMGRAEVSTIQLRDPTAPLIAAQIWTKTETSDGSPFWLRISEGAPSALIGDLAIRESQLPIGMPVTIGETRFSVQTANLEDAGPEQPAGIRHWLTWTDAGASVLWMVKKAASTPLSIYLAGETGTGKEVLAHLVHAWSDRASGPFVPLHCGALPLSLAESELFGHVKGAFTGAHHQRTGALMQAHGGTLFLDEIGDLPMDIQIKLLRFLENGEIRPVGADRASRSNARLLCATHQPLLKLVEEGKFRRDLYYRLASVTVEIPTLRSRPKDIEMLATRFAEPLQRTLSPRALLRLMAHTWPGNVRELRHAIERASGLSSPFTPLLGEEAFDFLLASKNLLRAPQLELGAAALSLREMERLMLLKALRISHGNRRDAARVLGVARSTLFEMIKRHRIHGPRTEYRHAEVHYEAETV